MKNRSNVPSLIPAFLCGLFALAAATAGCGENTSLDPRAPGANPTGSKDGQSGGVAPAAGGVGGAAGQTDVPVISSNDGPGSTADSCAALMGARFDIDDPDAIKAALPGYWLRCGHALTS